MKEIHFNIDGSTAPYNSNAILLAVKKEFKEATMQLLQIAPHKYTCKIKVNKENWNPALNIIKHFASHAMQAGF